MTAERYKKVKEVFLAVCERPDEEQDGAAAGLCGDDAELKAEVHSLLQSHRNAAKAGSTIFLAQTAEPANSTTEADPPAASEQIESPRPRIAPRPQPKRSIAGMSYHSHSSHTGTVHGDTANFTGKGRFDSGTVLAERYRIVSLLGLGGMGEVYRADDITLEQPVALKFLPPLFESNPAWLERFHNEVRLSRQVTHPNVCRVFDLGQVDGEQFISMEFVDGEDLASLLRRIGRLPRDKAIQIARQLCAGLAAAHDKGVLHRDLKPANVMLDGRGQVRITDFGISGRVDGGHDATAGTPAYMAPEQFSQGEATVRSDIYALGLVLYEIFTGRPAFAAHSMPEYARLHRHTSPTHPSTFIEDMDPLAERVIMRCLEKDPSKRPGSALAVAAALPGGDPLAAALAAGETPSPEMVAAAGDTSGLTTTRAGVLLSLTLLGLTIVVMLAGSGNFLPHVPANDPPEVLADRVHDVLLAAGYSDTLSSRAQGFALDDQYIAWLQATDRTATRWSRLAQTRPGAVIFWYRESPQYMISKDDIGMVTLDEPARSVPGMRTVVVDLAGHLKQFEILPRDSEFRAEGGASPAKADFSPLFKAADLHQEDFVPIQPSATPPMFADTRLAWRGHYPERPDAPVEVNAASFQGRPVFFDLVEAWKTNATKMGIESSQDIPIGRNVVLHATLIFVMTISALVLAWRNIRAGRGDSAGAQKLAGVFLILGILSWMLGASHVPEFFLEMRLFFRVLGFILVPAGIVWMFYLALEPYVRRIWPETVISWSRLLTGRLDDPLVASHVLVGLAVAGAATVIAELANIVAMHLGHAAPVPNMSVLVRFLAKENPAAMSLRALLEALYMGMLYLLSLVLFQLMIGRRWIALITFVVLVSASIAAENWPDIGWVQCLQALLVTGLIAMLLVRFGLVATLAALWAIYLLRDVPITNDMTVWYARQTRFAVGLLSVVAVAAAFFATRSWRHKTAPASPRPSGSGARV
ncbi:MAG TPA: protein kinase [Tepidisphaeraceae bacterium]|jgi:serine/threonine-protein kinase|nr:protein kinase [Tepidisphaeraceae bacterium]